MIGGSIQKVSDEEFKFWADLKVEFIMVGVPFDFFLNDEK